MFGRFLLCEVAVSPPPSHTVLFGRKSLGGAYTWVGSSAFLLEGRISPWITWNCCVQEICLFAPICLLTQLFISVLTHRYLFYTLIYNPMLLYFIAQIVLVLSIGRSFSFVHWGSLWLTPIIVGFFGFHFLNTSLFCRHQDMPCIYFLPQSYSQLPLQGHCFVSKHFL